MSQRASDGIAIEMVRTIWSFTYQCPSCTNALVYFHHLDGDSAPPKSCPTCSAPFARRNWRRAADVTVAVVVPGLHGKLIEQPVGEVDLLAIAAAAGDRRQYDVPSLVIDKSREMYTQSGLGKIGLTEISRFFSSRNAIALLELWRSIQGVTDANIRKKLSFALLA